MSEAKNINIEIKDGEFAIETSRLDIKSVGDGCYRFSDKDHPAHSKNVITHESEAYALVRGIYALKKNLGNNRYVSKEDSKLTLVNDGTTYEYKISDLTRNESVTEHFLAEIQRLLSSVTKRYGEKQESYKKFDFAEADRSIRDSIETGAGTKILGSVVRSVVDIRTNFLTSPGSS